jgi:anaerobic magnesium-protoporphyrin IX monomethyl ester cyclase
MEVLFTHSYFLKFDPKQWKQMRPYPPLGTLYAAAMVRQNGFDVFLHDVMFADGPASLAKPLQVVRPDALVVYDDGFNYLTKMCLTNMRDAAFAMCKMAKNAGCKVIVCSSDAADHAGKYLDNGADYVIVGEGELTLVELLQAVGHGNNEPAKVPGIVFRNTNGHTIYTSPRKVMHDLDALPLPAWDLVDIDKYKEAWQGSAGYFSINVSTTRGCPFKCNWCAKPIYGNRYNARSPQHVVDELVLMKNKFGFGHVWFCDDIFGLKPGWIMEFAAIVRENDLRFRFKIQSRADLLLSDEQTKYLAAAGCETVWIGAESGSQKILDAMDKGITTAQIAEATGLLKSQGISVGWFLQFGYPGETKEDIYETLEMVKTHMPDDIGVSVSYPLPGTQFYEKVGAQLKQKANWTDSDDLALMFRNTYSPVFYRRLHRYVHAHYRKLKTLKQNRLSLRKILKVPYYLVQERWYKLLIK